MSDLRAEHAIHVGWVTDDGTWPLRGPLSGYERAQWPMPVFGEYFEQNGNAWRVEFDDTWESARRSPTTRVEAERLPSPGLSHPAGAELYLTALLR